MTGLMVVDASVVVALVTDGGELGEWAAMTVARQRLGAPWLMPFEAGNTLRRHERAGLLSTADADLAHDGVQSMPIDLWPQRRTAERAWELCGAVSYYDASYVALAEMLGAPLVTLDRKLTRAPGPRCEFRTPPEGV